MSEAERFDLAQLRRNEHARSVAGYIDRQLSFGSRRPRRMDAPERRTSPPGRPLNFHASGRRMDKSLATFDGAVWYRKTDRDSEADWTGRNLLMELGPIDDSDIVWFNGARIASSVEAWPQPRKLPSTSRARQRRVRRRSRSW